MKIVLGFVAIAVVIAGLGWRGRAASVASLVLEIDRLERALDTLILKPASVEAESMLGDAEPEPVTARPDSRVRGPLDLGESKAMTPGRATLGVASREAVRSESTRTVIEPRATVESRAEPEVLVVSMPSPPRLGSWIESDGTVFALVGFGDGSEVWLSEGETHRGYRVVHADRRVVILHDPRPLRATRLQLGGER